MDQDFLAAFERFSFLKLPDLFSLFKATAFKSYQKGEIIAREGEYCPYTFFVRKGIIRTYVLTHDGNEKTIRLVLEKDFTGCAACVLQGLPSTEFLEAVEDCKVLAINIKKLEEMASNNIRILRLLHEATKDAFLESMHRIEFFTILTPEQRYNQLMKESPALIQRVPQKYLASYLGITTVSLSRIRSRKSVD